MTIFIVGHRVPRGKCRICSHVFYDTDSDAVIGEHNRSCAQRFYEREHPRRAVVDALTGGGDVELQTWMRREYLAGRLKPDDKPV